MRNVVVVRDVVVRDGWISDGRDDVERDAHAPGERSGSPLGVHGEWLVHGVGMDSFRPDVPQGYSPG